MKTTERHRLKENEVAATLGQVRDAVAERSKQISVTMAVIVVLAALAGGYWFWRSQQIASASELLADARAVASAPVAAPPTATPGTPAPVPVPNSFPTEAARNEAALKKFEAVAAAYPSLQPGLAARFQVASLFAEMGKLAEAERTFQDIVTRDGDGLYGRMARLGIATLQVRASRFDPAIQTFSELSQRTDSDLPVDGILMQLADAYRQAGKLPDAIRTYTRIADEFPESPYATDARSEADRLKAQAAPRS
jgi:TolA-binding protein